MVEKLEHFLLVNFQMRMQLGADRRGIRRDSRAQRRDTIPFRDYGPIPKWIINRYSLLEDWFDI